MTTTNNPGYAMGHPPSRGRILTPPPERRIHPAFRLAWPPPLVVVSGSAPLVRFLHFLFVSLSGKRKNGDMGKAGVSLSPGIGL